MSTRRSCTTPWIALHHPRRLEEPLMAGHESTDDGTLPHDPFRLAREALDDRIKDWQGVAGGEQYVAQITALDRITEDFISAIRAAALAFDRYPHSDTWILQRSIDDFLESAVAIRALAREGIFNVGRRELRYLLEAAVKNVFVDQAVDGDATLEHRIAFLNDRRNVPRSSVDPVDHLTIRMLPDPATLKTAVRSAFGNLSGYTHLSKTQLEERLRRYARGEFSGFESPATLEAFSRLLVQTYDVVLALVLEGVGPSFAGDIFIGVFDDNPTWRFHKTKFVGEMSHHFDYKVERKQRVSETP
jgi:hypothetical protein